MGSSAAAPTATAASTQNQKPNKKILSSSVLVRTRLLSSFLKFLKFAINSLELRKQHRFFIYKSKIANNSNTDDNSANDNEDGRDNDGNENLDRNSFNNCVELTWKLNTSNQNNYENRNDSIYLNSLITPNKNTSVIGTSSLLCNSSSNFTVSNAPSAEDNVDNQTTNITKSKENSVRRLETINDVQDLAIELIPQLIEHWLECTPGEYPNTPDNLNALQLILDLMVLLVGASSEPSHHPTSIPTYQTTLINTILPLFLRYIIVYFPFVSRTLVSNNASVDFAQKLNEAVCVLMTSFLTSSNFESDWSDSILKYLLRSIEKRKLNASMYVVLFHYSTLPVQFASDSPSYQTKMNLLRQFTDFVKQIQPRDQIAKEYSITFIIEVMSREIDFTQEISKRKIFKQAIIYKPSSTLSSNFNDDNISGNITEILDEWLTLLAKFIWQIGNKHIDISKNILQLFQRFAKCSLNAQQFRAIFLNFQPKLSPFFFAKLKGKDHFGPFSSLPVSLQNQAIELLYYFESISSSLLFAISQCCAKMEDEVIIYLLEIMSYKQSSISPDDFSSFIFSSFLFIHENFVKNRDSYHSRIQNILPLIRTAYSSSTTSQLQALITLILDQITEQLEDMNDNDDVQFLILSLLKFYSVCIQLQLSVRSYDDIELIVSRELTGYLSSNNLLDEPAEKIHKNVIAKFFPQK